MTSRLYRYLNAKTPSQTLHVRTQKDLEILPTSSSSSSPLLFQNQDPSSSSVPDKNQSVNPTPSIKMTSSEFSSIKTPDKNKNSSEGLQPMLTEDAVGGNIPHWGFSLRLVTGGYLAGDGCSRCHWLTRCQGCLVPRDASMVSLFDISLFHI